MIFKIRSVMTCVGVKLGLMSHSIIIYYSSACHYMLHCNENCNF